MYEAGPMRRKSVDIGGLALALAAGHGCGSGWGGWDEDDISEAMYVFLAPSVLTAARDTGYTCPRYAEFLSDMYTQTQSTVNYHLTTWRVRTHLTSTAMQSHHILLQHFPSNTRRNADPCDRNS